MFGTTTLGGDTLFANQYLAYSALSHSLKDTLGNLKIVCKPDKAATTATRLNRIAEIVPTKKMN